MANKQTDWTTVGVAFAVALGVCGMFYAISRSEATRYSPAYYHQRYHWLNDSLCNKNCHFLDGSSCCHHKCERDG